MKVVLWDRWVIILMVGRSINGSSRMIDAFLVVDRPISVFSFSTPSGCLPDNLRFWSWFRYCTGLYPTTDL